MPGCHTTPADAEFSRAGFFRHALARNERQWQTVAKTDPPPACGVRWIYDYALLLAESGEHPRRIDRLVRLGERMQDTDPQSPTCGNFRWYWRTDKVTDLNAVEFVSHHMIPLWAGHRDTLSPATRARLERTLRRAAGGVLRHKVSPSYTNIAIANAVNLILLGEQFGRQDAQTQGLRRLEDVCRTTGLRGICEYDSPTYYGVALDLLVLLDKYVQSPRARRAGRAMLEMFWTDIAVNWYAPGHHLGGTHSRSYNFPCGGSDFFDRHIEQAGWTTGRYRDWAAGKYLDSPERRFMDGMAWLDAVAGPWQPPVSLREIMDKQYPREIHQRFGPRPAQWRRHVVYRDITLGCSGKACGSMDQPITVSLPGDVTASRCYFLPDGREDPYGKRKFSVGSAGHTKALHLVPLWAAAAGGDQALAIALYPDRVVDRKNVINLQSHFVVRKPDAIYVDAAPSAVRRDKPLAVALGSILTLRYGRAAVAVCIPWATRRDQKPAVVHLVDDGNPHDVLRLTVEHWGSDTEELRMPGAAIWVCIGSDLDDAGFERWQRELPRVDATVDEKSLRLSAIGGKQPVRLTLTDPWRSARKVHVTPPPPDGVLSLNGTELGRGIFEFLGPIRDPRGRN